MYMSVCSDVLVLVCKNRIHKRRFVFICLKRHNKRDGIFKYLSGKKRCDLKQLKEHAQQNLLTKRIIAKSSYGMRKRGM